VRHINQMQKTDRDNHVAEKVSAAIRQLLDEDPHLLRVDASERSISHRLGLHLTSEFPEWDVDCEYNRDHHKIKRLILLEPCSIDASSDCGSPVYPDVIVHKRGTSENLLVIEVKKSTSNVPDGRDVEKLRAFRKDLGYQYGLFLRLKCGEENCAVEKQEWIDA